MPGDAAGIAPRLLDPRACLECFYSTRGRLGVPRAVLEDLLARATGRTRLFVESYRLSGDPLARVRLEANERALAALPGILGALRGLEDALRLAALANSVDVAMPWGDGSLSLGGVVADRGLSRAVELLGGAAEVAYLLDNSGEAVVDIAVALWLAGRGVRVRLVARSEPYEVDVTEAEARRLLATVSRLAGLDERGVDVVGTGSAYPAPARGLVRRGVEEILARADAVVMKGIANLEAAMEYCSVDPARSVELLRAKCPPIAGLFNVDLGAAVVAAGYECLLSRGGRRGS